MRVRVRRRINSYSNGVVCFTSLHVHDVFVRRRTGIYGAIDKLLASLVILRRVTVSDKLPDGNASGSLTMM